MVRSASATLTVELASTIINTITDGNTAQGKASSGLSAISIATGTSADQCDRAWSSENRALADTIVEELDFDDFTALDIGAGAGNDAVGQAIDLAEVMCMLVVLKAASAGKLEFGPGHVAVAANAWPAGATTPWIENITGAENESAIIRLSASTTNPGIFAIFNPNAAGYDIAAAKGLLGFKAVGGAVTYSVFLLGRSA